MEKAIFQDDIFQEKNLDLGLDVTLNSFLPFSFLILLLIQHFFKKLSKTEKLNILQMIAILWTTRSSIWIDNFGIDYIEIKYGLKRFFKHVSIIS